MNKYEIIQKIENFAPLDTQGKWDCSGWLVETDKKEIKRIMLALTVTEDIVKQAAEQNCDMIISHHPLFFIPFNFFQPKGLIDIYCAHTNMDKAKGGTTDTLADTIFPESKIFSDDGFVRYVICDISINEFVNKLRRISPNLRYVNNNGIEHLHKIAFCAGSGSEFVNEAYDNGADAFVTGDVKFHTAVESPLVLFDIGHFESEIMILDVFKNLLKGVETVKAVENSPFIY